MTDAYKIPDAGTPDVWERLAAAGEPIFLYGTGNGADKIIDEFERRGIRASGVFASDGFVRDRTFRGFHVRSYGDVCRDNGSFAVALAFGASRTDVLDSIARIASERTLICPDVPAFGSLVFDSAYYVANYDRFAALSARLADDESRRVLARLLEYKLSGDIDKLFDCGVDDPALGVVDYDKIGVYVDLGAYTGDTVKSAVLKMKNLRRVYAFEPEARAYKKLSLLADGISTPAIKTYNAAAWDESRPVEFVAASGRGSSADARGHKDARRTVVDAAALDDVDDIARDRVDYIKFDVEGAEARALRGASGIITGSRPILCVSVYHRTGDLLDIPELIDELFPNRKFYLRRERGLPAWGIDLFVV